MPSNCSGVFVGTTRAILTLQLLWLGSVPRNSLWCFSIYLLRWCFVHRLSIGQGQEHVHPSQTHTCPPQSPTHNVDPQQGQTPSLPSNSPLHPLVSSCLMPWDLHTHVCTCTHMTLRPHGLFNSWPGPPGASNSQFLQLSDMHVPSPGHFGTWLPGHFYLLVCAAWEQLATTHCCMDPHLLGLLAPQAHGPL